MIWGFLWADAASHVSHLMLTCWQSYSTTVRVLMECHLLLLDSETACCCCKQGSGQLAVLAACVVVCVCVSRRVCVCVTTCVLSLLSCLCSVM
jgi:hypothetical protein